MKKFLISLLGGALLAATVLSVSVSAADVADFADMPDDWSTPALTAAVNNGLLTGSDGMILPKDNLTRAQMATIISRAFGAISTTALDNFTDVPSDKWYYEYMQKAVAMGVFTGDGSGLLNPDNNITREQVFAVLARAFKLNPDENVSLASFADSESVSSWATGYVNALVASGYVKGSVDSATGALYLNPKKNITRAEFAQIMHNIVKYYIDEDGAVLSGEYEGGVIIRAKNVVVEDTAKISGKLVVSEAAKDTKVSVIAQIDNIVDNRKTDNTENGTAGGTGTGTGTGTGSGNNSSDETTENDEPKYEKDEEGWSGIYKPGSSKPKDEVKDEVKDEEKDEVKDEEKDEVKDENDGWSQVYPLPKQ